MSSLDMAQDDSGARRQLQCPRSDTGRSCPPLRRRFKQLDDDSLDVPLFSDGPFTQLLCKLAPEFECEEKPNVAGKRRWLRSTGDGHFRCCRRVEDRGQSLLRGRREWKLGLVVTTCRWCASPSPHRGGA